MMYLTRGKTVNRNSGLLPAVLTECSKVDAVRGTPSVSGSRSGLVRVKLFVYLDARLS
jgi:hypothetical protein